MADGFQDLASRIGAPRAHWDAFDARMTGATFHGIAKLDHRDLCMAQP